MNSIMLPPPPLYNAHRPPPPSASVCPNKPNPHHGNSNSRRRRRRPQSPQLSNSFRSCPPPPPPQPRRHRSISPTMMASVNDDGCIPNPNPYSNGSAINGYNAQTAHMQQPPPPQQHPQQAANDTPKADDEATNILTLIRSSCTLPELKYLAGQQLLALTSTTINSLEEFQAIKRVVESDDCEAIVRVIEYCMLLGGREYNGRCSEDGIGGCEGEADDDEESVPESYTSEHDESVPASYCEEGGHESICSLDLQDQHDDEEYDDQNEEESIAMDCYQQIDSFNDRLLIGGRQQFYNEGVDNNNNIDDDDDVDDDDDEASTISSYHFLSDTSHIERNIPHQNRNNHIHQPLEMSYREYLTSIRNGGFEGYVNNSSEELFCQVLCRHAATASSGVSACGSADESTASTSSTGASTSSSSACSSSSSDYALQEIMQLQGQQTDADQYRRKTAAASRRPPPRRMKSLGVPSTKSWAPPPPPPRRSNSFKQLCNSNNHHPSAAKQLNKSFLQGNGSFHNKHPVPPPPPPPRRRSVESTQEQGHSPNSVMDVNVNVNESSHPHSAPTRYNAKGRVDLPTLPTLPLPEQQDEQQQVVVEEVVQEVISSRGDGDKRKMGSVQELFESVLSQKQGGFIAQSMPRQGTDDKAPLSMSQDEPPTAPQAKTSFVTVEDSSTEVKHEKEDTLSNGNAISKEDQDDSSSPQQCPVAGEIISVEKISSIIDTLSSKRNVLDTLSSSATTELPPLSPLVEKRNSLSTNNSASLDVMLDRLKATSSSSSTSTLYADVDHGDEEFTNKDFIKSRYTNYLQQQLGNDDEDSLCESLSSYQQHMKQMFGSGSNSGPQNKLQQQQQVRTSKKRGASASKKKNGRVNPQDLSSCISTVEENGIDGNSRSRGARLEVQLEEDEKEHSKLMANVQDFISQIQ